MSPCKHDVPDELLSRLLANYQKPEDLIGENGLLKQLTKLLVEKALDAEMTEHLGHEKHEPVANIAGNTRNGRSRKTLKGEFGELPIEVPRDRDGTFEPKLVPKHQTPWSGFDDKILSLYARGMTVREIQAHLEEMYGAEVSPSLISSVTDAVVDEVKTWQSRPLDWRRFCREHGLEVSMSRRGNCWDNSVAESFFSSLKKERVRGRVYGSREEARSDVFDYIEVFYNRQRRHGHLGGLAPMMFEAANSKSSS